MPYDMPMNAYPRGKVIADIKATKQITREDQIELAKLIEDFLIKKSNCVSAEVRFIHYGV